MDRSRRRRRALGTKTKKLYADTLHRAFGGVSPDFAPDLDRGGDPWPESTRGTLRAAVQHYWSSRGQPDLGERIADKIEVVYSKKTAKAWPTEPEVRKFEKALAAMPHRVQCVILVGFGLGLRSEGLLGLSRQQVEDALRYGHLTVLEKGQKERVLDVRGVRDTLRELLELPACAPHDRSVAWTPDTAWREIGGLLAGPESSLATRRNMLARHIKSTARRAGVDPKVWSPHTLRHVFATRMNKDGAPLDSIRLAMGHESITTTLRYITTTPEDVAKFMRSYTPKGHKK